jgi:membrane protein implicated in regulation of membrane protease activity
MLILGLLLIGLAAAAVVAAVFALDGENISYLGFDIAPLTLFLLGAASVLLLGIGARLARFGAKRELRLRRENRRLAKDQAERDRADKERDADDEH